MRELASEIRNNLDALAEKYERRLQEIKSYADMPNRARSEAARNAVELIAAGLEAGDHTLFTQFMQAVAAERVAQGFEIDAVQQALTILAEVIEPMLTTVETANFLWRAVIQAQTLLSQTALEKMRTTEEQFQFLADNIAVGIFIHQDGFLRYIGSEGARMLGYDDPDELLDRSILEFVHPDERGRIADIARRRVADEPMPEQYETRLLKNNGTVVDVWMYGRLTEYQGRTATLGAFIDISERKELERQNQESLERRGRQVQTATEVAQEIAGAPALDELFRRVVTLIKERFDYYHAQIFRYEPAMDTMVLVSSYGQAGKALLDAGHRLPMGYGVVGTAAATGQAVLASDVRQDADWVPNPHLPDTQGEMAVPIKLRDQMLGILDVQSDRAGALSEEDQVLLEGLCGQIAIAIESTRLRQETEESLRELEHLYRTTSREAWETFRREIGATGYRFDQIDVARADDFWTPEVGLAMEHQTLVSPGSEDGSVVVAPLSVRGEVLGALGIEEDPQRPMSQDDLALLEAVSEQVAQALESARLFEQTQTALAETEMLYVGSDQVIRAANTENVLDAVIQSTALKRLDRANFLFFDRPLALDERPDAFTVAAVWERSGQEPRAPVGTRYDFDRFPAGSVLTPHEPLIVQDTAVDERLDENTRNLLTKRLGTRSIVFWPIVAGRQWLGLLTGQSSTVQTMEQDEMRRITSLIDQAATVIQTQSLFEQAQDRAEELTILNEMSRALSQNPDVNMVFENVYHHVSRLMDTSNFYIALYDAQRDEIAFVLDISEGERRTEARRRAGRGLTEYVIRSREPLLIKEDTRGYVEGLEGVEHIGQESQSWLGVPMVIGDRVTGVIAVQSYITPRLYDEHHRDLLATVASHAAVAIESARLFEQIQARAEEERLVRSITDRVRRGADREAIMRTALQELGQMLGASQSVVRLGTQEQLLSEQSRSTRET